MSPQNKNVLIDFMYKVCTLVMLPLQRVNNRALVSEFLQQLTLLTATGLPLIQCLDILATRHSTNTFINPILKSIESNVHAGKSLGAACAQYPGIFSPLICTVLAYGERLGSLHSILLQLSEYELREQHVQQKIRSLWMCTLGGILSMILVLFLIAGKLISVLLHQYSSVQITNMIHESLYILGHYSVLWLLVSIVLIVMVYSAYTITATGKILTEYILYSLPVFGEWNRKIMLHRITHTLSILLAGGLSYQDALRTMETMGGDKHWVSKMLNNPAQTTLTEKFRAVHFFPEALLQLIFVGENSNSIASVLQKISDYYAEEIGAMLEALAFVVVPVMILVAGLSLGVMLYSFR